MTHRPTTSVCAALLLFACSAAQAHDGITTEGLAVLAAVFVALPIVVVGAMLWLVASASAPAGDRPLVGWRHSAAQFGKALVVLGLVLGGYLIWLYARKDVLQHTSAVRSEPVLDAACQSRQVFVGRWEVGSPGAHYVMALNADGSFALVTVYEGADLVRPAGAGQWRIEETVSNGSPRVEFIWIVGGRRIAQPIVERPRGGFVLQDEIGERTLYLRVGRAEPVDCRAVAR